MVLTENISSQAFWWRGLMNPLRDSYYWQWYLESEGENVSLRWKKWFSGSASHILYIAWALSLVLPHFVPHHGSVPTQGSAAKSSVHLHGGQATTDTTLCSHEQNKPFFFLSCLCQVFAYSGTKATNKIFFISLEFCLDIQIRNWFWKGKIYLTEIAEFMCVNGC